MSSIEIFNDNLSAKIQLKGAELSFLAIKNQQHNWLWPAEPLWPRSAPWLFPIVGRLRDDTYTYKGKSYKLSQHGFARDSVFEVVKKSDNSVHFRLLATSESLKIYPFNFELNVFYVLEGDSLKMKCTLKNLNAEEMLFNFGWHPGFVMPQQDKKLKLRTNADLGKYQRLQDGLIASQKFEFMKDDNCHELPSELFREDALVFLNNQANQFILEDEGGAQLELSGDLPPYFGLWTKDASKFVCLEPWWGHADLADDERQELTFKNGISRLQGEMCLAELEIRIKA